MADQTEITETTTKETSVSNLSRKQFEKANDIEAMQRHRSMREGLAGTYVGIGNAYTMYPAYTSALSAGNLVTSTSDASTQYPAQATTEDSMGLSTANGLGEGGAASSAAGAAGGSPA